MIGLKVETNTLEELAQGAVSVHFHPSFNMTYQKLRRWLDRFVVSFDDAVINDLVLFYSLAKQKFLDHRTAPHLFRLVLSIYHMQRILLSSAVLSSRVRHLVVRWMPTNLVFPFLSRPVLGCLMGFNIMDRCELFDEKNIEVVLEKHFPDLQIVKESYYFHSSQHESLKVFYFEVEKKGGGDFSLSERKILKDTFEEKIKNGIQKLVPSVFMNINQEEVYKNVLILSQEISSIHDLPQVYITLEQHTGKEIIFHISLVQIAPFHRFSFKERTFGGSFLLERVLPVRYLNGHPVEAYLFRILLPCEASLLRSDGSLDFYAARQKVVGLLTRAIGEFRDYNGGLLIKQQELLFSFKQMLPEEMTQDAELLENFFHALVPLDKQALLDPKVLSHLFFYFLEHRKEKCSDPFSLKIHQEHEKTFLLVRASDASILEVFHLFVRTQFSHMKDFAYNILELADGAFLNGVILNASNVEIDRLVTLLRESLNDWSSKRRSEQVLRIALGHSVVSLDPRVGGENASSEILRLLFEGLTRLNQDGDVENAVAESIEVSSDLKQYTFHLRPCFWNDGSFISAHDFAYSWKRILSPDFTTSFATFFYFIKNAREAKQGKVSLDDVGIFVLNDRTLRVELERPTPYFEQLLAHPVFAPIHRVWDQQCPQWPYQSGRNYPCNGPFQLKSNQSNQGYQLVKNPLYWNSPKIRLDQIILTPMDPMQAIQAFSKNEIDWVGNPFGPWPSFYAPEENENILSTPDHLVRWMVFNTHCPPFNHPKLRYAFSLAINREELIKNASLPMNSAYSILLPSYCAKQESMFPKTDPEKARRLFDEALQELGLSRESFTLQLIFPQKGISEWISKELHQQLQESLGIDCHLQSFPWSSCFRRMIEGKFQVGLMQWSSLVDDPIYTLNAFKFANEGTNFAHWEHKEFQKLLDLSEQEMNPFQKSSYLYRAEEILAAEAPVIPLVYQPSQAMVRKNVYSNFFRI